MKVPNDRTISAVILAPFEAFNLKKWTHLWPKIYFKGAKTGVSALHPGTLKHKYIKYVAIFHWFLIQKLHLKAKKHCFCLEGTQVKLQGVWRRPLHGNDSFGWLERLLLARALTGVSLGMVWAFQNKKW